MWASSNMFRLGVFTLCIGLTYGQGETDGTSSACTVHTCTNTCPDAWVTYQESCYYFGHNVGMPYVEAEHFCRQHNSHLVHVGDAMENAFLKDFLHRLHQSHYWMGLSDEQIEGIFTWSDDNTPPTFTDWLPNQPDDNGKNEDCGMFSVSHGFAWTDERCTVPMALPLCEKTFKHAQEPLVG